MAYIGQATKDNIKMLGHDSLSICLYSMYVSSWDNILFSMFSDKKHTECMSGNFTS